MKFKDHPLKTTCPACSHEMDGAMGIGTANRPKPGDFSLCIRCGAILNFDKALALVKAPASDILDLRLRQPETFHILLRASRGIVRLNKERLLKRSLSESEDQDAEAWE